MKTKNHILSIAILIIALLLMTACGGGGSDSDNGEQQEQKAEHSEYAAYAVSQKLLEDKLHSPSTAEYPAMSTVDVEHLGEGVYTVDAYVDAQNAYGAMVRQDYYMKIQYEGDDYWNVLEMDF